LTTQSFQLSLTFLLRRREEETNVESAVGDE